MFIGTDAVELKSDKLRGKRRMRRYKVHPAVSEEPHGFIALIILHSLKVR